MSKSEKLYNVIVSNAISFYCELSKRHPDNPKLESINHRLEQIRNAKNELEKSQLTSYNDSEILEEALRVLSGILQKFTVAFEAYYSDKPMDYEEFSKSEKKDLLQEAKGTVDKLNDQFKGTLDWKC